MTYHIEIQNPDEMSLPLNPIRITQFAETALKPERHEGEVTILFVSKDEMRTLNKTYRDQDKPTNVLSFPAEIPDHVVLEVPMLGDIVICPDVLAEEAQALQTSLEAHWAHIVVHGILHLVGYDHIKASDAKIMQSLETCALKTLGFDDPWEEN